MLNGTADFPLGPAKTDSHNLPFPIVQFTNLQSTKTCCLFVGGVETRPQKQHWSSSSVIGVCVCVCCPCSRLTASSGPLPQPCSCSESPWHSVSDESKTLISSSAGVFAAEMCVWVKILRLHKPQRRDNPLFKRRLFSQVTTLAILISYSIWRYIYCQGCA